MDSNDAPSSATPPLTFEPLLLDELKWHSRDEIPSGVPVLDYVEMMQGIHNDTLCRLLKDGYPFYIENYGITDNEAEIVYNATRRFFKEPEDQKTAMAHPDLPRILRGYTGYGIGAYENSLDGGNAKTSYAKYAWGAKNNVSPDPEFQKAYDRMFTEMTSVAHGILACIGSSLNIQSHSQWSNLYDGEDTVMHCQTYYPAKPRGDGRMISHADASVVTLLHQIPAENGHIGLRALLGGEYIEIPAIRGTLVVMGGESLNSLTNGSAKPVIHAVAGPTTDIERSERSSMPFFLNPRNCFEMQQPPESTHGKFYNSYGATKFGEYSDNIAKAYAETEGSVV